MSFGRLTNSQPHEMDPIAAYAECYRSVEQLARLGIVSAAAKEQIHGLLPRVARAQYDFAARNEVRSLGISAHKC